MIKKLKLISVIILFPLLAVNLCGCLLLVGAAAGGTGTALWLSGKLSSEVNVSYDRAVSATKDALYSLRMKITKETETAQVTQFRSRYSDGREVWVDIRPVTDNSSKIEIRVGAKGDKAASSKILDKIKSRL